MSTKFALGVYLPADMNVPPRLVPISGLEDIQVHVGGIIDAVTTTVKPDDYGFPGNNFALVGYVHDEGLLLDMPTNKRACVLFERELVGNVVIVSGTNPTSGAYDGDNYDVPEWYTERILDGSLDWVVRSASRMSDQIEDAFALAVRDGLFDQSDIDKVLMCMAVGRSNLGEEDVEIVDMIVMACLLYLHKQTNSVVATVDKRGLELLEQGVTDDMIRKFLDSEGGK